MYAYQQSCENYKVLSKAQKAQWTRKANSRGIREAFREIRPEIGLENGLIWTMELDILGTWHNIGPIQERTLKWNYENLVGPDFRGLQAHFDRLSHCFVLWYLTITLTLCTVFFLRAVDVLQLLNCLDFILNFWVPLVKSFIMDHSSDNLTVGI